jgi:hypothetical protein
MTNWPSKAREIPRPGRPALERGPFRRKKGLRATMGDAESSLQGYLWLQEPGQQDECPGQLLPGQRFALDLPNRN